MDYILLAAILIVATSSTLVTISQRRLIATYRKSAEIDRQHAKEWEKNFWLMKQASDRFEKVANENAALVRRLMQTSAE